MTTAPFFSAWLGTAGNHVWQSTVFALIAALLTLALRRNRAQVRYAVWLAASMKFLVPLAALVTFGRQFSWRAAAPGPQPALAVVWETVSRPFSKPELHLAVAGSSARASLSVATMMPLLIFAVWLVGCVAILTMWAVRWRRVAAVVRSATHVEAGREVEALRSLERVRGMATRIALVSSDASLAPGVFGIARPVLLWPRGMSARLGDEQMDAILSHEVCHVRRRDNLAAALHMFVEAVFWFNPVVWWVGARLMNERERACDEAVIRWGIPPSVYAESILKTCKFCVTSPFVLVSGVSGSDLNTRIEAIMNTQPGDTLHGWRKLLLAATGAIAMAAPVAVGLLNAPQVTAQSRVADATPRILQVASVNQAPTPLTAFDAAGHRLVTLLFDVRSVAPEDMTKAVDAAQRWVNEKMAPADLVAVATNGSSLQVLTGFTSSKVAVTSVLCAFSATALPPSVDTRMPAADWFNGADRLRALATRTDTLSPVPPRNAIFYFSSVVKRGDYDLQVQLRAAVFAAVHANVAMYGVAIYPVDSRSLPAIVPGDDTGAACAPPK